MDGVTVAWLAEISDPAQVVPEVARRLGIEVSATELLAAEAIAAVSACSTSCWRSTISRRIVAVQRSRS